MQLIEAVKDYNKQYFTSGSDAKVLSDTKTSINGLNCYEVVFSVTDPTTNDKLKHYYVFTGKDNVVGYYLDFVALESNFNQQLSLFKSIEQTIRIQ